MIREREFVIDDIEKIEFNDYAKRNFRNEFFLAMFLNDVEVRTLESENKIEALMFCGRLRDGTDRWYAFCIYAKDCSKMVVRNVRRKLKEKVEKGYKMMTYNEEQGLKRFHDFIFKEYL